MAVLDKPTTTRPCEGPLKGILAYTSDPVLSTGMLHNPNSSILDSDLTDTLNWQPPQGGVLARQGIGLFVPGDGTDRVPGEEGTVALNTRNEMMFM